MAAKLADLKLREGLLTELQQCGYEAAEDLADKPVVEMLRIPGIGGACFRKIAAALGRHPRKWNGHRIGFPLKKSAAGHPVGGLFVWLTAAASRMWQWCQRRRVRDISSNTVRDRCHSKVWKGL